ncbi:hypothetical protein CA13_02390 [Planctomycetes bacterium CA13]|uniref:Uncharacterized protein n=1 Tax=Novipirellula herctigrandis TaxID=2527986 RepID=A0A5C5YUW8_9BACT|nr:hypothetical protein CA13_02390 [Planctomycetes bacterium CA13]
MVCLCRIYRVCGHRLPGERFIGSSSERHLAVVSSAHQNMQKTQAVCIRRVNATRRVKPPSHLSAARLYEVDDASEFGIEQSAVGSDSEPVGHLRYRVADDPCGGVFVTGCLF